MTIRPLKALVTSILCASPAASGELIISEFMASNSTTIADEDGHYSDWIEIENTGSDPVDLANWYLTNNDDFSVGDPDSHWIFPSRTLAAKQRLLVFASSKDRKPAGSGELHTDFQLSTKGEYLALVAPDGTTIATEFSPRYPKQRSDISYGFGQPSLAGLPLVSEGDDAKVNIPVDGSDGLDWTGSSDSFNDSAWLERQSGVGFEIGGTPGGFTLIDQFDSLDQGELDGQGNWTAPVSGAEIAIDPTNPDNQVLALSGVNVRSWKAMPVANSTTATLFFRIRRDGSIDTSIGGSDIATPGTAYSDFEVQLNNQNNTIFNVRDAGSFDPVDAFEEDTWYDVWMVMNLNTDTYQVYLKGGANTEQTLVDHAGQTIFSFRNGASGNAMANFFARTGSNSTGTLMLDDIYLGEGANLGNPAGSPGFTDFIDEDGDIEAAMSGIGSGAYLRLPFESPAESFSSMTLKMRYDDGFVAYLNGTEIAARNAPVSLGWDSSAIDDRASQDAIVFETIDVTLFQDLLKPPGEDNILAIHGLNLARDDRDFLITPVLEAISQAQISAGIFFPSPTPNEANNEGILGFVGDTEFSIDRGFFESPFDLTISSGTENATIVYTLDGSTPSLTNGSQQSGPVTIKIAETTPVRAAAFKTGFLPTDVDTQTYLFLDDIIAQGPTQEGYPTSLKGDGGNGSVPADYEMDPEITESADYRDVIGEALLAVPTISIVTDKEHLFDPGSGIYQNPQQSGSAWERPTSVEFIRPDGLVEDMQLNAGIRIQGGHTRLPSKNPKHSFRLSFKDEYGPKSLNYELFPGDDGATQKFDQLILRGAGNQSWLHHNTFKGDNRGRAQYIRDQWAKDLQLAMSGIGVRSLYAHLYINGIYWGLYNPTERATAGFGESYLGGEKEDYNTLNSGDAIDGVDARSSYLQVINLANSGLVDPANYAAIQEILDLEDFTDYMMINQYGGNLDWDHHNWYAIQNRNEGKWRFICWDAEFIFISPTDNVLSLNNSDDPSRIWLKLMENEEYQLLFADKVQEHLTNGGLLTPGPVVEHWDLRKNQMFDAIVAESARWGDYRRDVAPVGSPSPIPLYDRDEDWTAERERLFTQYFPVRTDNILQQYRAKGYLPALDAPVYSLTPGMVAPDSSLEITSPDGGNIFYTLDGSDPRVPTQSSQVELLPEDATMKVLVALNDDLASSWHGGNEPFDDDAWITGTGAGFETTPGDYEGLYDIDLNASMRTKSPSCYLRLRFDIPDQATLDGISSLTLNVRYDDGFAAFINGDFAASDNAPDPLTWDGSNGSHQDSLAKEYQPFTLPQSNVEALKVGTNILAIHAFNANKSSSDFLIDATLEASVESEEFLSPGAMEYTGPITIEGPTIVSSRVRNGINWSALTSSSYFTAAPAVAGTLAISEVMYHPVDTPEAEYLELENISATPIDLTGVYFSDGIDFTFPFGITLAVGERLLLTRNLAAFQSVYGDLPVTGEFQNGTALSNSGELLTLKARDGSLIQSFEYGDSTPWPTLADGSGSSLILRKPAGNPNPGMPQNWRNSANSTGNPGSSDATPFIGSPDADADGDGLTALMEYALGTSDNDPSDSSQSLKVTGASQSLILSIRESQTADDALLTLEVSSTLNSWDIPGEILGDGSSVEHSDGTIESRYPLLNEGEQYLRFKVELR